MTTADPPNLPLLIKLLKMTTSSQDGEALSAIRKANEQLAKFGGDWEALLRNKVTVIGDPFAAAPAPPPTTYRAAAPPPPPRAQGSYPMPPSPSRQPFQAAAPFRAAAPSQPRPAAAPKSRGRTSHVSIDDLI